MGIVTPAISASNLPNQVTTDDPQGEIVFPRTTSLGAFFGGTPIARPSGQSQVALTRGQQGGAMFTINGATASPALCAPNTTVEKGITLMATGVWDPIASGDIVFVNKPTSQAGLGVGNVRVSASNVVGVTFSNFTAATITPTATQSYAVVAIRGFIGMTVTLTPAAVAPTTIIEQQFNVSGIRAGDLIQVNKPTSQVGLDIVGVRTVSSGVLGITFANLTAATITPTAGESYSIISLTGIDAVSNLLVVEEVQSPAATSNAIASAAQSLTFTGLAATDIALAVQKPTLQANLIIGGFLVTSANTLSVSFGNFTSSTITPTATEVYAVAIFRPNPVAPLVVFTQTLTPASVAANTTAEQTFTITGANALVASSPVWVNKPSFTSGLGIVGVRVSAANTLAINYGNATANAIVPPSEAYIIGNFQIPLGDAGSTWIQPIMSAVQTNSQLTNASRNAMVNLGLMVGA